MPRMRIKKEEEQEEDCPTSKTEDVSEYFKKELMKIKLR